MSFLFDEKSKKAMKWVWIVLGILIIASMVVAYSPGLFT